MEGYAVAISAQTNRGLESLFIVIPTTNKEVIIRRFDTEEFAKKVGAVFGQCAVVPAQKVLDLNPDVKFGDIESDS